MNAKELQNALDTAQQVIDCQHAIIGRDQTIIALLKRQIRRKEAEIRRLNAMFLRVHPN